MYDVNCLHAEFIVELEAIKAWMWTLFSV